MIDYSKDYLELSRSLSEEIGKYKSLESREKSLKENLKLLSEDEDTIRKSLAVVSLIAEKSRERIIPFMESLVTKGLQCVFGDSFSCRVSLEIKGNKPVLEFFLIESKNANSIELNLSTNLVGGGVKDVVALVLRIIFKILFNNVIRGPLILDEPFSALDKERSKNLFIFLKNCSRDFGMQIILVTHDINVNDPEVQENFDTLSRIEYTDEGVSRVHKIIEGKNATKGI